MLGLTGAGAPLPAALCAVLLYRVVSNGSVIVGGWSVVAARSMGIRNVARTARRLPGGRTPADSPVG